MTLKELNRYSELREDVDEAHYRVQKLREAAEPGAQVVTGMPHGSGVQDKIGDLAVEIADLETQIAIKEAEAEAELDKLTAYIDTIRSDYVRILYRLRFVRCLSWAEVAKVIGGPNTASNVKITVYRHIDRENKKRKFDTQ